MANVAPGIITFGLGGNQSNMIIGFPFNLGSITVQIGSPIGSPFPPVGSPITPPGSPIVPPGSPTGSPVTPTPPVSGGGGGAGGIPLPPGRIQDLYRPVEEPWHTLQDYPDGTRFPVTIRLKIKDKIIERNYIVTKKRANMIVKITNFVNKFQASVNIKIRNFKKRAAKVLGVFNMRKK